MAKLLSGTRIYGTGTVDSQLFVNGNTAATSTTTGALQVVGGAGIGGDLWLGGGSVNIVATNTNLIMGNSSLTSTGTSNIVLGRNLAGDAATIKTYASTTTNLRIFNGIAGYHFDLASFATNGWGPAGTNNGARIRIDGATGDVKILNTTSATAVGTGALQVSGGASVSGNLYVGGTINANVVGITSTATNVSGGTTGQIHYQSAPGVTQFAGPGTSGQILISAGTTSTGPVFTNASGIQVGYTTNVLNGTVGQILFQSNTSTTSFAGPGAAGQLLVSAGTTSTGPVFTNTSSIQVGYATNISGGSIGAILYQSNVNVTSMLAATTSGYILQTNGVGVAPSWSNVANISAGAASKLSPGRNINGTLFDGTVDIAPTEWYHSTRDFTLGTLITTSIDYSVVNGDPFILQIRGNSYGSLIPFDIQIQGYIYNSTIINTGGYSVGPSFPVIAMNVGGALCFWFARQAYWQGFNVHVYTAYGPRAINKIVSITNVVQPAGGTKLVTITPAQVLRSDNIGSYTAGPAALTSTYVGFGSADGTLTGSTNLTWDGTKLSINSGALGTGAGTQIVSQRFTVTDTNTDNLEISNVRGTAGADWQYAGWRLQQKVDSTWMGYIQFNGTPNGLNNGGISFGSGTTTTNANSVLERVRINGIGNVGIGTASPNANLEVSSATGSLTPVPTEIRISTTTLGSDWSTTLPWGRLGYYSADLSTFGPKMMASIDVIANATSGGAASLIFNTVDSTAGALTERMRITNTGKVGIGTTDPTAHLSLIDEDGGQAMLQVRNYSTSATGVFDGTYSVELRSVTTGGITHGTRIHLHENNNDRRTLDVSDYNGIIASFVNGKVGIGTTLPQSLLNTTSTGQVQIGTASWPTSFLGKINARTIIGNEGILVIWNDAAAAAGNEAALYIGPKGNGTNGSTIIAGGSIKGISESSITNNGALTFGTNGGGGNNERMRITSAGAIAFSGATNYGTANQILQSNGNAAPTWVNASSIITGSASLTSTYVGFGSSGNTLTGNSNLTWDGKTLYVNGRLQNASGLKTYSVTTTSQGNVNAVYEIMKVSRDSANWSTNTSYEITVRSSYYTSGGYTKWLLSYGYGDVGTLVCTYAGGGGGMLRVYLGLEVSINANCQYKPVFVDLPPYMACTVEVRYNTTEVAAVGSINSSGQVFFSNIMTTSGGTGAYYSGATNLVPNGGNVAIGNGVTAGSARLHVVATAATSIGGVPSGTTAIMDSNTNNYLLFRNTVDNGTYSGIVMQDNNIGGFVVFGNANGGGDQIYVAGYGGGQLQYGSADNVSPSARTTALAWNSNGAISFNGTSNYGTSGQVLLSNGNAAPTWGAGYGIPQNSQSNDYTTVLSDAGKHIYHPVGAPLATYTISGNSSVNYPIGTTLTFVNFSSNYIFLTSTDTLYLSTSSQTGAKLISTGGWVTALKITSTAWVISGTNLTPAVIPGNSGILTSGNSYTLPISAGTFINVLVVAGGGGGGGGSGRTFASGYYTGGGGGGAGGNAYRFTIPVALQGTVNYTIGAGGAGGSQRDGIFSGGSNGSAGGNSSVTLNSVVQCSASGGNFGYVSPSGTPGGAGTATTGSIIRTPTAGYAAGNNTVGGLGANGYVINTTVGLGLNSIFTYGAAGTASNENSGVYSTSGTVRGAGGTGGGCAQSDVYNYNNMFSTAGTSGAVFIWWGY